MFAVLLLHNLMIANAKMATARSSWLLSFF